MDEQETRIFVEHTPGTSMCCVCLEDPKNEVILECGHVICFACSYLLVNKRLEEGKRKNNCPMCRKEFFNNEYRKKDFSNTQGLQSFIRYVDPVFLGLLILLVYAIIKNPLEAVGTIISLEIAFFRRHIRQWWFFSLGLMLFTGGDMITFLILVCIHISCVCWVSLWFIAQSAEN